jgi:hypothetical protein
MMYRGIIRYRIGSRSLSTAEQSAGSRLQSLRHQLDQEDEAAQAVNEIVIKTRGSKQIIPKPAWLKADVPGGKNYERLRSTVRSLKLATVCEVQWTAVCFMTSNM